MATCNTRREICAYVEKHVIPHGMLVLRVMVPARNAFLSRGVVDRAALETADETRGFEIPPLHIRKFRNLSKKGAFHPPTRKMTHSMFG